jgi:hypothetical protein
MMMKLDDDPFFVLGEWAEAHGYDLDNDTQRETAVNHYGLLDEVEALRAVAEAAEPVARRRWVVATFSDANSELIMLKDALLNAGYLAEEVR